MNQILLKITLIIFGLGLIELINGEELYGLIYNMPSECIDVRNSTQMWKERLGCKKDLRSAHFNKTFKTYKEQSCPVAFNNETLKNCDSSDFEKLKKYTCIVELLRQDCVDKRTIDNNYYTMEDIGTVITKAQLEQSQRKHVKTPDCFKMMMDLMKWEQEDLDAGCPASLRCSKPTNPKYKQPIDTAMALQRKYEFKINTCINKD